MKCSIMLDPDLYEWAKGQKVGLAETVRQALRAWRATTGAKPKSQSDAAQKNFSPNLAMLPEAHQATFAKAAWLLTKLGEEPYRMEIKIYAGGDQGDMISWHDVQPPTTF